MKRAILTINLLLLVAGCNETIRPTAWILNGSDIGVEDNPIVGRLGVDNQGVGFGLELNYAGGHIERQSYGAYITAELEPTPIGTPYIGYHALLAIDEVEEQHGPIVGTLITVGGIETVIEGQYNEQADESERYKAYAGVRIKF